MLVGRDSSTRDIMMYVNVNVRTLLKGKLGGEEFIEANISGTVDFEIDTLIARIRMDIT